MIKPEVITKIGIIAALYVVITLIFSPISYGPIQVRFSEGLTILPFFLGSWSAVGLWIGCMIANFAGGLGLIDVVFGSLLSLIAGLLTARAKNIWTAGIYPVVINAFGVALILKIVGELGEAPYLITVFTVGLGQVISVYLIGVLIIGKAFKKTKYGSILE